MAFPSNPTFGQTHIEDGIVYEWDNVAWVQIDTVPAPAGYIIEGADFPASPSIGEVYTFGSYTWTWDGLTWVLRYSRIVDWANIENKPDFDAIYAALDGGNAFTGNQTIDGDVGVTGTVAADTLAGVLDWSWLDNVPGAFPPMAHTHTLADITDAGSMAAETAANYLSKAGNLSGLADLATSRTNLGLGTMAVEAATDWLPKAGNLSGLADLAASRTNLGLGTMAVETASDYLTKAGNLSGLADPATARTNLGVIGAADNVTITGNWTFSTQPTVVGMIVDNGAADGGNLILRSSGFDDWYFDNNSQTLRVISGGVARVSITQTLFATTLPINAQAVAVTGGYRFDERADHFYAVTAGKGEIWFKNDTPNVPMVTTDDGVDHVIAYGQGNRILAHSVTASDQASVSWLSLQLTRFVRWEIEFENVIPATDGAVFQIQLSNDGGATWFDSAAYAYGGNIQASAGTENNIGSASAAAMALSGVIGNASGEHGLSGRVTIMSADAAALKTYILSSSVSINDAGQTTRNDVGGSRLAAEADDALRFRFSTGNVLSGVFRFYGILA